jgi:hypothetical protein
MATSRRNHGTDQEPNGINGGAPPSAAREAEAAVYAGLVLDLCRGFGAIHNRASKKPLDKCSNSYKLCYPPVNYVPEQV